jgi:hypothetical protein
MRISRYDLTAEDRAIIDRSHNQLPKVNRASGLVSVVEEMLMSDAGYYEFLAHQRCAKKFGGSVVQWVSSCIRAELRDLGEL